MLIRTLQDRNNVWVGSMKSLRRHPLKGAQGVPQVACAFNPPNDYC